MMHLNTHYQHKKDVLNRVLMRLSFVVFILLGFSYHVLSQTLTVCDESTFSGYDLFEADHTPNGHRSEGEWSSTGGLIFSNVNDPNSLITVPSSIAAPTTVTIVWTYKNGTSQHSYDVAITANTWDPADGPVLLHDGTTDDVLLCSQQDVDFSVNPPGSNANWVYQYWTVDPTTGLNTLVDDYNAIYNYTLDAGDYTLLDGVFSIVKTNTTGCTAKSNEITISDVSNIQVQVVGGYSVCVGAAIPNVDLEVIPFNTSDFNYTWYFDDGSGRIIVSSNTSTYSIDPADGPGDYYVEVEQRNPSVGCPGVNTSNIVSVRNYELPDVTVNTTASICSDATQVDLTSSLVGTPPVAIEYDWYRNTSLLADGVTGTTNYTNIVAPLAGTYKTIIREQGNEECWKESNSVTVSLDGVTGVTLTATNGLPSKFCLSGDPNLNITITGGTPPYEVTFSNDRGLPAEVISNVAANANLDLNTLTVDNTNYWVSSITDASGCSLTFVQDATSSNYASYGVYTSPSDRPITSNTICETSSTNVQLPNSEVGIDYAIYRDGVDLGEATQAGTGGLLTWGPYNTAGTYQVYGNTATCPDILMSGFVYIEQDVALVNVGSSVAGTLCSDPLNPITFSTDASENGVDYTLYRDYGGAGETLIETLSGNITGTGLSFTPQSTAGTYSVIATRNGVCDKVMTNTYVINASPDVTGVTLSATSLCEGVNTTLTISDTETGVTYILYYDDGTGAVAEGSTVAGFTGNSRNIVLNQPLAAGDYTVMARITAGTCTSWISDMITIVSAPTDIDFVTDGFVCNSGNVVLDDPGEAGVTYTLYKNGFVDPIYAPLTGNGVNTIQFNGLVPGTYTVLANNGTCSTVLSDQLVVETVPIAQTITVADNDYCANEPAVSIQVDDTQGGVEYELYNQGTSAVDQTISGTGAAITFTGVTNGVYTVRAQTNSCSLDLQTGIVITEHPVAAVNANIPTDFCSDDANPSVITATPLVVSGSSTGLYQIIGGAGFDPLRVADPDAGTLSFDPGNTAFETLFTIQYTYTDGNGCVVTDIGTTTVHDLNGGAVTIDRGALPANPCQDDDTDYTLTGELNNVAVNGTFSSTSPGFTDADPTDSQCTFNPYDAGNGTHVINFDYTDAVTNCTGTGSITITIGTPLSLVGANSQYCSDDNTTYDLDGSPSGGTFTVTGPGASGVIGSGIADGTAWLNPVNLFNTYGVGTYSLVYEYPDVNGCTNTLTSTFDIVEAIDASFIFPDNAAGTAEQTVYCKNDSKVLLTANGTIGAGVTHFYTGLGVAGNYFYPGNPTVNLSPTANVITHTVDNKGCTTTDTRSVYVTEVKVAISGLNASYCTNGGKQTIIASGTDAAAGDATFSATINGNPTLFLTDGGVGDNSAEIDPSVGSGVYEVSMNFIKAGDGCDTTIIQNVTIYDEIPVSFWGVVDGDKICTSSADITLTGTLPDGGDGNYTLLGGAVGLTDATADDGLAVLSPSTMTPGNYTVRYEYESTDGCLSSFEVDIEIVSTPTTTYSVTGGGAYCIDDPAPQGVVVGLSGSDSGVEYELLLNGSTIGAGITHTGVALGGAFDFAPVQDGEGTYTVIADYGGCTSTMSGSVDIEEYELVLQQVLKTDITCNGLSDGIVTVVATGGSGSYEYAVDGGAWQASPTFTGLTLGDHDFSVKDLSAAACEAIDVLTINITQPTAVSAVEVDNVKVGCSGCSVAGGTCEGSSTITISGGTPDYVTYPGVGYGVAWSTGGTDLTENNMPAGNHSVTVTDGNGCTFNLGILIETNPALTISENAADHEDNVCKDGVEGSYTVTAAGGSGSYEFSLTDPATTAEVWLPGNLAANQYQLNNLEDGSYNIWVRDANPLYNRCITQIAIPIVITEPIALGLAEESQTGITCNGATDGSFVVRASGGESGTYQFTTDDPAIVAAPAWVAGNSGADGYTETLLGAGTYTVWVRDLANPDCGYTSVNVVIADVPALSYTLIEHTNVSCNLGNNGRLEVLGQGGSGNYVYQWKNSVGAGVVVSTDVYAENLNAADGPYTVTITDVPNSCGPVVQTFTITEPAELTVQNVTVTEADCAGQNTGSIELEVVGGTAPYTITWSTGASLVLPASGTITLNGLAPGNYNIDIVDSELCNYNNVATPWVVGQLNPITNEVPATIVNNTCNGNSDGSIYVKVDGGSGDYQFRLEGPVIIDWSNSTSATLDDFTFTGLVEGNYDVKVRDANNTNCEYLVGSYTLTDPVALGLSTQSTTNVSCYNGADGSITVLASGGSGVYEFNVDNNGYVAGGNPFTESGLSAGDHTIWIRDVADPTCQYQLHPIITLSQFNLLDLSVTSSSNLTCNGSNDGEVVLTASGGSGDYDFSKDGGATWDVATTNSFNYDNLSAGLYSFQVRDHNNTLCAVDIETLTITEPLDFSTSSVAVDVDCNGESTGQLILTTTYSDGSAGAFTYSIDGGATWQASPITGISAGVYVVDVKDNTTNCVKTNQVIAADATVTEPAAGISIGAELITHVTCNNGTDGEIDLQATVAGGTVAGDYTYTWFKKGIPDVIENQGVGLDHITNLAEGTYYVTVEDDNGCSVTSGDYVVNEPSVWNVDFTPSNLTKYNGGDGAINVHTCSGSNGGYSIAWYEKVGAAYNHIAVYDDVWNVTTLDAGTYQFVITDSKSCTYTSIDITLTQPFEFTVTDPNTTSSDISCYGGSDGEINVIVTQGNSDYTINVVGTLENGNPNYTANYSQTTNTFVLNNLEAGSYYIELTDNVSGELFTSTVVLTQPNELTVSATPTDITCEGFGDGEITVVLSGNIAGAEISWTADNGFADGPLDASVIANLTQSGLEAGNYTVTANNNNGCPAVQETDIIISEPAAWSVTTSVTNVTSYGHNDGAVAVDFPPTGNTAPYTIAWGDDVTVTAWSRSGLTAGNYIFTIIDATTNCTYSETLIISEPNQLLFDVTPTDATCYGTSNGSIGIDVTSGNPDYEIKLTGTEYDNDAVSVTISNNSTGSYVFTNLSAGSYDIKITDSEGENLTKSVTIDQLAEFSVSEVSSTNITCNSGNDGEIEIEISRRVINENTSTINWTRTAPVGWSASGTVAAEKVQTNLEAGTYTINVLDEFGCAASPLVVPLTEPDAISATHTLTHVSANGLSDGRIVIDNVENNVGLYTVAWYKDGVLQAGVTSSDYNNIDAGTYYYVITDSNSCTYRSPDIYITEPGALVVSVTDTDINCYGDDNGIITVNITSGNAPYTVTLTGIPDDGSGFTSQTLTLTNSVFTGLKPGEYQIVVTDNASQTETISDIEITQNSETVLNETLSDITCHGEGDGTISMVLAGNVSAADSWQVIDPNGATVYSGVLNGNATQPAALAGDYNVIVTNQDGCLISETYAITEPDAWNVHHNVVNVTPTGNTNGEINIDILSGNTPNAGSPDYNITWSDGLNADARLRTGLSAGTYSYHIEDAVGCTYDSGDIIVSEPAALSVTVTESDVDILCYGEDEGELFVNILSGNEPYTIHFTGNQYDGNAYDDTQVINTNSGSYLWSNLVAGEYQVEITDNVGNVFTQTGIMLTQPDENVITENVSHLTCYAAEKGAGEVSIQLNRNFLASDKVIWSGPMGIIDNGVLVVGSDEDKVDVYEGGDYTYIFTDGNGCSITGTITVIEPDPFTIDWDVTDATIYNLNDGIIDVHTITGSNGVPYTISWSDDAAVNDFLRNDLLAGTYEFTITDPLGCDTTISNIIVGQPNPLTVVVTPQDAICYGDANGEIQVEFQSHNGGYYYQITGNEDDGDAYDSGVVNPTSVNSVVSNLEAGTYTIDAYDSKGTQYHEENIRIEQDPEVSLAATISDISCYGAADGSIDIALDGRAALATDNIVWSGSKGTYLAGDLINNNQIDPVSVAEIFNVIVTSAKGCTYSGTFEVDEPNEIVISIDDIQDVTCVNGTDGEIDISVTGRSGGGYTYIWEKKDGTGTYQPYTGNTASLSGLSAGEYQVTVESISDNCTATYSDIEVLDGSEITITETLTHITSCVGDDSGVIAISVEDGIAPYTVDVTGQATKTGDGSSAFVFSNLVAGDYVIEVSDARGTSCATVTKNVTITEPANTFEVSNLVYDIDCDPLNSTSGTFTFDITGGVPSGGNYRYQILLPEASIAKPVTIAAGSTHTENISGLSAGTYNLTVLDLNSSDPANCALEYQFTLEHIVISNNAVVNTTCDGINNGSITGITIEGASANYTYNWTTTDGGLGIDNSNLNQSGLSVGTYILTITDPDRAGCTVSKEFYVDVDNTIIINPTVKDVSCNGGTDGAITLDVSGISPTTSYTWTGPAIVNDALQNQVDLSAGNYTVEVTSIIDGQTCIADAAYTVAQPNPISYTARYEYTDCDPYTRTLIVENVTGGSGNYTYLWDGPAFTPVVPADPTNIEIYEGGVYSITVKDENQCELSKSLSVSDEISIDPVINDVTCSGGNNGSIVLNVSGGSGQYTFSWVGPSGYTSLIRNIDNLYAGEYTVRITDQNENDGSANCYREYTLEIDEPDPIEIVSTVENTSCFGASDGQIEIEVSGGTAPYTYNWSPVIGSNQATDRNQYDLPADTYTVTVTDAAGKGGCIATKDIEVQQDDEIILSTVVTDTQCDGTAGAIDLSVTGGSGSGFAYDWSSADGSGLVQGDQDQTGLSGGTFTVVVSDLGDGRSCKATISETLTHEIEVVNEAVTPVSCSGNDDGTISYDVSGGDGNYTYTWNVISGDPTRIVAGSRNQSGLSEGEYEVTITDGRLCTINHTFTVDATTGLSVNVAVEDSKMCFGEPGGKLTATVTGGSGDYTYYWNGVEGTNVLDNLVQGIYGLEVVDNVLGCNFIQSYEITGPSAPLTIESIVVTDVLCYNENTGAIQVTVSGGTLLSTGDYIYTWTGGAGAATGSNPANLYAGTYNLTITDANGCTVESGDIIVDQPTSHITIDNPQITDVSVVGGTDGAILVDVYDGVAPRSVEWFDDSNASLGSLNPVTGLSSGTYSVIATDNNGCTTSLDGIRVIEPGEALGFEKTVHQVSPCNGADNGEIHINRVFGGYPIDGDHYRIQITGPGTNVDTNGTSYDLTGLAPGTYRVIVTDNVPVTYQEDIVISEYTPLTLTTNKLSDVTCFGTSTGAIEVIVSGGKADVSNYYLVEITSTEGYYNYKDNAVANTAFTFSGLPAGNYTVRLIDHAEDFDTKVPDRGNCELSEFTLITEPSAEVELSAVGGDNELCNGESIDLSISTSNWDFTTQGNLRVAVYDNFTTTEYVVDKSPYVITETPSSSRTYKIMGVVDPANATCLQGESTGSQVQVVVNELPTANITGPTQVCEDGTVTINVSFTGSQPFSFTWQDLNNGTSNTISGITSSTYSFTDNPISDASYIILDVSDDNTCSNTGNGQVDVTINNKPIVTLSGSTDICIGETTPLIIGFNEDKAPYTITYEANGVEGTLVVTPDATLNYTWNVSPVVTTTYEITSVIDSKGCIMDMVVPVQATVIVNQLPEPLDVITSTLDNGEVCQGISGIDYSVETVTYATNYVWTVEAGMNITSGNGTNNITVDFDRDFAGGYVRVYAENDCGVSSAIERWVNAKVIPDPIIDAPTGPTQLCQGATGLIYSIDPVDNATSYEWTLPTGLVLQGDGSGTSIIVNLDPDVPSTVGDIYVRPINECSDAEPWSPALTVTINPLPEPYAGLDDRICQTTYTLNADPLNAGETGLWTIEDGAAQYVNKAVDQVRPNAEIYNLSQGENTFTWTVTNSYGCSASDEVTISNDQVTVNTSVSDGEVCDGTVTLFGTPVNALINADEGVWTTTGSGFIEESTNDETIVNNLDQGINSFTWTIRKGSCYSSSTVEVVNNQPTEPIIYDASDIAIDLQDLPCQTDFTTLRGTSPAADETGYWRIESGALTIDNKNSATINITSIAKGDHVLSWNILHGDCLLKALVTIRNNALDVDAGNDRYSCDGTTMLSGTAVPSDASGQWTIIEGSGYFVEGGDQASTQVTGLDQSTPNGQNIFRWTLTRNGCQSYDEVTVYNDQPSTAEISGGSRSISICGYEYNLHAVTPQYGTGVWSVVGGQGKFDNPADPNTRVYDLANGDNVFRWTVSNNTCSTSVDFTVTNLHVEANAGADTAVCERTAKLNATPVPDGATGQWTLVSGSAGVIFNPSSTQPDASATSLSYGTNALVWTVTKDGCVSRDTVIVSNNSPYEVDASTYIYTDGSNTTLRAEIPDVGTGVWSLLEGRGEIANPTSATTQVTNLLPNYNYFRWTVENAGCSEYIDVAVQSGSLADAEAGLDQLHLCEDYTTLSANEPEGTYGEWTIVEGSADFESYNSAKTNITNIRSGQNVFRWTLRFAGGSDNFTTDTVIIINNKPTDADAGLDIFQCGDMTTLNAREPVVGSPSWSVLSGGGVFADETNPKSDVTDLAKGENVFKYQIQQDICFSYDTISVFNYEPSEAYAGEDQVVCVDYAVLNPEIPKYGEGSWKVIEGSGKGQDEDGNETDEIEGGYVYSLAPGVNKLVWEVKVPEASSSCVKRDTLTIVNNEPSTPFAGHDRSICTDTVMLSGSVPVYGVGTWTLLSGSGDIVDTLQTNTLVRNLSVGKNRFRWTIDNNGCSLYSDVEIANNLLEAFAGYDQVNCVDTASLEGNNASPGVGTWGVVGGSGSANFEDNESPLTEVKNLDKGENILTWTIDYKGCRSVSEVKITNNEPSEAIAGDNKATCENSIVLGAATPEVGTGSWTIRSGGGDFEDDFDNSTQVNNLKFGSNVFRWTVENEGCTLYDDVEISFNRIDAEVGGTQEICADHTFLEANNASPGVGTWSVVGGSSQARFVDTHDATTEVLDLAKGSNLLRWTINNEGCSTSAEVTVINHTPSTAYAGNTQEICESATVLDATDVSIGTGSWEVLIGAGTITSAEINNPKANITGISKGENVLRWTVTSDNGLCTSTDDVTIINNEPSEPYAGADEEYCSPTVVLKAAVPDFGTGNWSIIEGGGNFDDSTLPDATISNLNEGVNVLRWTITQGQCTKYSDIEVLNNTPTTASAGPDIEDCLDYAELDANEPTQGDGYWTLISGNASFVDDTNPKTRVEGLTFGENVLMWNVQKGGCISSDQITIFNQIPDQAEAGTDRNTCEDYLTLNANNPNSGVGTWTVLSGNGEFDDLNSPTTIVRELGLGENRFKWTVAYGSCTTEDVVEVVSNKADPYAGEDAIVYDSDFELKASNPGDLGATWSIVAGTGDFDDNTYFNTTVRNLSEGVNTFRWLMDVNGCITYDDVSIEYRVVPDAAFVVDTTQGCYPLTIEFTNYSDGGSNFLWEFGDGYSSTDRNPVHTYDDPGVYTVTLTAPGPDGVNGIYTKDITVFDHPVAEFSYSPDIVYVPGDLLRCYSLSIDAENYLWDFGDGNTSTDVNPLHEYTSEGVFDITLTVESQYGCIDELIKANAITAVLQGFVKFPTAFMPRPDGGTVNTVGGGETNTVFRPVYRDVDQYKLQIFNRWGQLIYESTDIDEGWNGFYNSELSPQGVYVWKATGNFISGKVFTEAGSVLLVR